MSKIKSPTAEFTLVGQLLDFVIKDGYKVKYLRLTVSEREYWIKLPKELRHQLDPQIMPGVWLKISGIQERCLKTGKLKLEADAVHLAASVSDSASELAAELSTKNKAAKASILVCQKSSCRQRGGDALCQAIAANLQERGLEDRVQIKKTGCLKQCKQGPNLIIMPDKVKYSYVDSQQVPALLEKHIKA
jgi:(2Fe-2S) ferredoxin